VAERQAHAHPLEIRSIAEEIRDRGHVHRAEIVSLERLRAMADLAEFVHTSSESQQIGTICFG
jgi:DNA-binding GntR family transcriptional regulator